MCMDGVARYRPEHDVKLLAPWSSVVVSLSSLLSASQRCRSRHDHVRRGPDHMTKDLIVRAPTGRYGSCSLRFVCWKPRPRRWFSLPQVRWTIFGSLGASRAHVLSLESRWKIVSLDFRTVISRVNDECGAVDKQWAYDPCGRGVVEAKRQRRVKQHEDDSIDYCTRDEILTVLAPHSRWSSGWLRHQGESTLYGLVCDVYIRVPVSQFGKWGNMKEPDQLRIPPGTAPRPQRRQPCWRTCVPGTLRPSWTPFRAAIRRCSHAQNRQCRGLVAWHRLRALSKIVERSPWLHSTDGLRHWQLSWWECQGVPPAVQWVDLPYPGCRFWICPTCPERWHSQSISASEANLSKNEGQCGGMPDLVSAHAKVNVKDAPEALPNVLIVRSRIPLHGVRVPELVIGACSCTVEEQATTTLIRNGCRQ